jgi:RimJ/RimL family protein N-acetyltransferase
MLMSFHCSSVKEWDEQHAFLAGARMTLEHWQGKPRPERVTLEGRYTRLEPLHPERHGPNLYDASSGAGAEARFRFLSDRPPENFAEMQEWLHRAGDSTDPMFFAVVDCGSGRAEGRQALMRIDPAHGVIEIGNILWGPAIAKTRIATEALYLLASYVFDHLGYRRLEWKCDDNNEPSKRAARRFGFNFEGIFRQHKVVKGLNRDTAWFSILDGDWPTLKRGYEEWLADSNFDNAGIQIESLSSCLAGARGERVG